MFARLHAARRGFDTSDTSVGASVGTGTATINVGGFGTGWHSGTSTSIPWNLGSVPGATGLGDLGQASSIVLSGLSGNGLVTLRVFQWVDRAPTVGL